MAMVPLGIQKHQSIRRPRSPPNFTRVLDLLLENGRRGRSSAVKRRLIYTGVNFKLIQYKLRRHYRHAWNAFSAAAESARPWLTPRKKLGGGRRAADPRPAPGPVGVRPTTGGRKPAGNDAATSVPALGPRLGRTRRVSGELALPALTPRTTPVTLHRQTTRLIRSQLVLAYISKA